MALSEKQLIQIKDHLDNCKNPLFFFDDDQDGLCSFLQFYRYKKEGKGSIVKTTPKVDSFFLKKVEEYNPDKIFILDMAIVEQDFLDEVKVPVVWIDHHGPFERHKVHYFNPRVSNQKDNHPTSYLCYQVLKQDKWIAALGCVADWFLPPFIEEFKKEYPDLVDYDFKSPGDIIYNTKLGDLIRIFSFVLKGRTTDVMKSIKTLTRIESPYEILNNETSQGKFINKRFNEINKMFLPLQKEVLSVLKKSDEKLAVYIYRDDSTSFTSDLGNEAIYRNPEKIILIGRERSGQMKCSLRSTEVILPPLVEKALIGLSGYGGGHEHACGLNVAKEDFDEFVKRLREMI
ncbi:MAG TPA: DHH family phosphoesterase [Candidatus Nanoarchaeia archaeon]|nr:DHH family phosphoesterase [Candidatus Nanoarchaeia archaeon]